MTKKFSLDLCIFSLVFCETTWFKNLACEILKENLKSIIVQGHETDRCSAVI